MSRITVWVCAGLLLLGGTGVAWGQRAAVTGVQPSAEIAADTVEAEMIDTVAATELLDCNACGDDASADAACCCECPVQKIAKGEISGYGLNDPNFRGLRAVIHDPQAWGVFWRRHTAHLSPAPAPPAVDFQRFSVVAAILGVRPTGGGPAIHVARVGRCDHSTIVHVAVNNQPGPLDVVTNPFHFVRVPKVCMPLGGSVVFVSHEPAMVPGLVVGRVFGAQGPSTVPLPIAGAGVRLTQPGDPPIVVAATETDEEGVYRFPDVVPGPYVLVAGAEGYRPLSKPVQVTPGAPTVADFLLLPAPDSPADDDLSTE